MAGAARGPGECGWVEAVEGEALGNPPGSACLWGTWPSFGIILGGVQNCQQGQGDLKEPFE